MTGGDVLDGLIHDEVLRADDEARHIAFHHWGNLISKHKPNQEWRPISPPELVAIREELARYQFALQRLERAILLAKTAKPKHFYVVAKGGR